MTSRKHWETHLYTYAVALTQGDKIRPENLSGMRDKAIRHGHTEGECQRVEADPAYWIRTGRMADASSPAGRKCHAAQKYKSI